MSKRQGDWRSLSGIRKVRRTLTYTPASYVPVASAPAIYRRRGHRACWKNRPRNQKPYGFKRGLGIPYGCEGPCKVQSFDTLVDVPDTGSVTCISNVERVRDRRPEFAPLEFGKVFNMFDNEPTTATITADMHDHFQVLRRWSASVTGGTYAHREQDLGRENVKESRNLQTRRRSYCEVQVALVKRQNSSEVVIESYLNLYHIVIPVEWFSVVVEHLEIKGILNVPNKNGILFLRSSDEFPAAVDSLCVCVVDCPLIRSCGSIVDFECSPLAENSVFFDVGLRVGGGACSVDVSVE
ncbi:hypothetical protein V6N13_074048 [Hibiscus sabdariffa]